MTYSASRHRLEHQSRTRTFTLVTPDAETVRPPVLLYFHGSLQSSNVARNFTGNSFDELTSRGVLVAYPDGVHHHFNDARRDLTERTRQMRIDDVGFTRRLIDALVADHGADPDRVYACGFSNGGQMVLRLLHEAPGLLAGAASFAATLPAPGNRIPFFDEARPVPTPFLQIHGTEDPIAPYRGGEAGMDGKQRGAVLSALATAEYFAGVNGMDDSDRTTQTRGDDVTVDCWRRDGVPPVELVSVAGMGHLVPSPRAVDERLGSGTSSFVAAELAADFFGL